MMRINEAEPLLLRMVTGNTILRVGQRYISFFAKADGSEGLPSCIRNPALLVSGASLYVDISDTIDVMPSGFTYTCGDFSPWFISFPVMVIKKFHFFWENDHHHPFYEYFFGSDYI